MGYGQYARDGLGGPNRPFIQKSNSRGKHVFSGDMVAHVWAQQTQDWGKRSDGRIFFEGRTIYSYGQHFPIAEFVEHKGKKAVLFNISKHSCSTLQHQRSVRGALRGRGIPVLEVPKIPVTAEGVRAYYEKECEEAITKAARAKSNPQWYMNRAKEAVEAANAYAKFFGCKWRLKKPNFTAKFLQEARDRAAKHSAEKAETLLRIWRRAGGMSLCFLG